VVTTDGRGVVVFEGEEPGEIDIEISAPGFTGVAVSLEVPEPGVHVFTFQLGK
jgi:hypothetical protein